MDDEDKHKFDETHARAHFGQEYGHPPVLPFDDLCSDLLHMYLNLEKGALSKVFHEPLQVEKRKLKHKGVKEVVS